MDDLKANVIAIQMMENKDKLDKQNIYQSLSTRINKATMCRGTVNIGVYCERFKFIYAYTANSFGIMPLDKYKQMAYFQNLVSDGFIGEYEAKQLFGDEYEYFYKREGETDKMFLERRLESDNIHLQCIFIAKHLNHFHFCTEPNYWGGPAKLKQKIRNEETIATLHQERALDLLRMGCD